MICLLSVILFFSCSHSNNQSHLAFDQVQYVEEFPQTFEIPSSAGEEVKWDLIDSKFIIYDTLFIVSTVDKEGLWTFLSTKDYSPLGSFLKQGEGPNEFIFPPNASRFQIYKQGESLKGGIHDTYKGFLYEMDIYIRWIIKQMNFVSMIFKRY